MAEEDSDAENLFQSFVFEKENVVVEGDRCDLGESFSHSLKCAFNVADRHRKNPFEQRLAQPAIDEYEEESFSAFPRHDEISLHVPEAFSFRSEEHTSELQSHVN